MSKITGRPPGSPDIARPEEAATDVGNKVAAPGTEAAKDPALDKFERSAKVGAQLETRLQALAGKAGSGKIQFTNEDIAYLANTFANIISQNPNADRLKRARLFAKAILKRKKRKVFAGIPESEMEQMCEIIGDVLDSSPVFGQLVDNVTEGANKLNAG